MDGENPVAPGDLAPGGYKGSGLFLVGLGHCLSTPSRPQPHPSSHTRLKPLHLSSHLGQAFPAGRCGSGDDQSLARQVPANRAGASMPKWTWRRNAATNVKLEYSRGLLAQCFRYPTPDL